MDTQSLAVFVHTVAAGSIAAASRRLGIAPVLASRRLIALEKELGVRLVHRTTRSLSLTAEGQAFLSHARDLLDREAEALSVINPATSSVSGLLRLTAPAALGREVIMPILPALLDVHPQLRVELQLTERIVDLIGEGLDLAIRIADLPDTGLVARRIGTVKRLVCAAPDYISRHGMPSSRRDLAHHDCLPLLGTPHWQFQTANGIERTRVSGRLICDTIDGVHAACRAGLGIAMLSIWSAQSDLDAGTLVPLPLDAQPYSPPISALYPSSRMVPPRRVRVFLEAIAHNLQYQHTRMNTC